MERRSHDAEDLRDEGCEVGNPTTPHLDVGCRSPLAPFVHVLNEGIELTIKPREMEEKKIDHLSCVLSYLPSPSPCVPSFRLQQEAEAVAACLPHFPIRHVPFRSRQPNKRKYLSISIIFQFLHTLSDESSAEGLVTVALELNVGLDRPCATLCCPPTPQNSALTPRFASSRGRPVAPRCFGVGCSRGTNTYSVRPAELRRREEATRTRRKDDYELKNR